MNIRSSGLSLARLLGRGVALIDTCAIIHPLEGLGSSKQGRNREVVCKAESSDLFRAALRKYPGRIFITETCSQQYLAGGPRVNSFKRESLVRAFKAANAVLAYKESNSLFYSILAGIYRNVRQKYELNEANLDFILSGGVLAVRKEPAIVVSNNLNLLSALNEVAGDSLIGEGNLIAYVRSKFNGFERYKTLK
jgi:hypothetical protein